MKRLFSILPLLFYFHSVYAQYNIKGWVVESTSVPLVGASVRVAEQAELGTITDKDGRFTLQLPSNKNYTIEASFLGYQSQQITIQPLTETLRFVLQEDKKELDMVVITGTRTSKNLSEAPIITRVISHEEIKKIDATNVSDLLQAELPGIEFSATMNQQMALNMTGFGGNSILFLVDGERLAGETLDNIDYSRLNLDNVERIEIIKGATSSLYGSNAVGGVVNIISRQAKDKWSVDLNGKYGSHNEQRYGGSVGLNIKRINSITSVQYTSIDEIDLAKNNKTQVGDIRKLYGNTTLNAKERLVFLPSEKLAFTGRVGYFFRERNSSTNIKERYRGFSGGLKSNYSITTKDQLELSYSFDQYDKSDYFVGSKSDIRDYSNVQHILSTLYNHTFADRHILTIGGDYMRDYLMSYQFTDNGQYIQHSADGFVQFDYNPLTRLNVIIGGRFDYFSRAKLWHLSPKVGIMYRVKHCSLRGAYSTGFRTPTLKEMYMNFDMANIFTIYGNDQLKAEKSHNFSISAEYMQKYVNVTMTSFYNLVDNRITTAWNRTLQGQMYTNMARLWIAGADMNVFVKLPCGVSARFSYAYTYEHVKQGQPVLSATRPHALTTRLGYDKSWKNYGLSVALSGRFVSKVVAEEYLSTSFEQTVEQKYPSYTLWKLILTQNIRHGIDVVCTVDNLFNYRPSYYYSNSPLTTGTTFSVGLSLALFPLLQK